MKSEIKSPLTGSYNTQKERDISVSMLVREYKNGLNVEVGKYFKGIDTISIYRCLDTGYRFYYPLDICGDGAFYEQLQKHKWYYMDSKWEHTKTLELITGSKRLLEIGCAQGEFLMRAQNDEISCVGLELNSHAASVGRKKGLEILEDSIQKHALTHKELYDVVCSFQVAEHVADIAQFTTASLDVLKPGGKLIMSVPNNDSIVFKVGTESVLNMPPHHMGLWNMNSLIKLPRFFPINIEGIYLEPLQSYHAGFGKFAVEKKFAEKIARKHLSWVPFLRKFGNRMINMSIRASLDYIVGHSILIEYIKK